MHLWSKGAPTGCDCLRPVVLHLAPVIGHALEPWQSLGKACARRRANWTSNVDSIIPRHCPKYILQTSDLLGDGITMGDSDKRTQDLLIFHANGLDCAFPLEAVREIVPMATLSNPPGLPAGLAGFLDLRGTAIPIIRLDRLFDLPEQQMGLHTPMIVLRGVLGPIGILTESVRGILPIETGQLLEIPEDRTFHGCATAAMQVDGDSIHVLSSAALLDAGEARLVADYGAMWQARRLHLEEKI
jgi:purine-binding chemotaxis protein CheW